jgi:hypothetical protein
MHCLDLEGTYFLIPLTLSPYFLFFFQALHYYHHSPQKNVMGKTTYNEGPMFFYSQCRDMKCRDI